MSDQNELPIESLDRFDRLIYRGCSNKEALFYIACLVSALIFMFIFVENPYDNKFLALHTRDFYSVPAIFFFNFVHKDLAHLINNLTMFLPLGFAVLRFEGIRGLAGIFSGMLVAGAAVWLFGRTGQMTIGFSGAVFACWGILLIFVIRRSYLLAILFLFVSYLFFEVTLFESIRPTAMTANNNISWHGHLGGMIGGMASQIRSTPIALEILYKNRVLKDEEFATISNRILNSETVDNRQPETDDEKEDDPSETVDEPKHSEDPAAIRES